MASPNKENGEKLIATNPLARADYFIDEVVEAGLVLTGTEVKSLRAQAPPIYAILLSKFRLIKRASKPGW